MKMEIERPARATSTAGERPRDRPICLLADCNLIAAEDLPAAPVVVVALAASESTVGLGDSGPAGALAAPAPLVELPAAAMNELSSGGEM